jgi:hypothetical protein
MWRRASRDETCGWEQSVAASDLGGVAPGLMGFFSRRQRMATGRIPSFVRLSSFASGPTA